jgi:hypothetical protein
MNDFHLMNLANDRLTERRAEADRSRLARSSSTEASTTRRLARTWQPRRSTSALSTLFHRVALF